MRTSVEGSPSKNIRNKFEQAVALTSALGTVGAAVVLGPNAANAEPVYSAPGTGQGWVGPAVAELAMPPGSHHHEVQSPALTPILDLRFLQSVDITKDNYANEVNANGEGSAMGFSASSIALHEMMAERPDAAFQLQQVAYVGDPCKPGTGILVVSVEARTLSGQVCPGSTLNPGAQEVQVFDREDPISNFHYPVSAIDLANLLAAYEMRHPYTDHPDNYEVTEYEENGVIMRRLDHRNSALRDWLAIRGIHLNDNDELIIQGGLHPDARAPQPAQAANVPMHEVSAELAPPPADPIAEAVHNGEQMWQNSVVQPVQEFVETIITPQPAASYEPTPSNAEVWQQEVPRYVAPEVVVPLQQLVAAAAPLLNMLPPAAPPPPPPAFPALPPMPWG